MKDAKVSNFVLSVILMCLVIISTKERLYDYANI